MYATGSTIITGPEPGQLDQPGRAPIGATPVGDQVRRAVTVLHGGVDHARRYHAKAGPRMGATPAAIVTTREGARSEIVRPVLVDPWRAWQVAGSGQLFAEPIPRLSVDARTTPDETADAAWAASLRTGWVLRRPARLHVSASPSLNVTVLELIPARRRRIGNRSFLRVGLAVVEELAHRLEGYCPTDQRSCRPASSRRQECPESLVKLDELPG